jgi:chromosome segregation ATPase
VEYITVEKEASMMDGRIAQMMQDLDQNIHERESLEAKLHELEEEKKGLEMEKSKKDLLDPQQEKRLGEVNSEIAKLKAEIENMAKSRR